MNEKIDSCKVVSKSQWNNQLRKNTFILVYYIEKIKFKKVIIYMCVCVNILD